MFFRCNRRNMDFCRWSRLIDRCCFSMLLIVPVWWLLESMSWELSDNWWIRLPPKNFNQVEQQSICSSDVIVRNSCIAASTSWVVVVFVVVSLTNHWPPIFFLVFDTCRYVCGSGWRAESSRSRRELQIGARISFWGRIFATWRRNWRGQLFYRRCFGRRSEMNVIVLLLKLWWRVV